MNRQISKEEVTYQDAQKNYHLAGIKLRLYQQGVDTESLSQQKLDMAMRLYDEMDKISLDSRNQISKVQNDANLEIQKINQKTNEKYNNLTTRLNGFVDSLKKVEQNEQNAVPDKENIEETISEEIKQQNIKEEQQNIKENVVEDLVNVVTKRVGDGIREEISEILEKFMKEGHIEAEIV